MKKYRHYKGKIYTVIGEAIHSETDEPMVIYTDSSSGEVFVRPYKMFHEEIDVDGCKLKRFEPVNEKKISSDH